MLSARICQPVIHRVTRFAGIFFAFGLFSVEASAQALVGNPFINTTATGWTDAFPPPTRAGNWRLSLHNPTPMDTNNASPGTGTNTGTYQPDVLYQNNFLAPATYDLNATMRS